MLAALALLVLRSVYVRASSGDDGIEIENEPTGFPGGKIPTAEELLKALESMTGLSDEEKEQLRQDLLKKGGSGFGEETASHLAASSFISEFFMLIGLLTFIGLIFVFFGYKLYKSLSERERKREEKKKNKQMKKKK